MAEAVSGMTGSIQGSLTGLGNKGQQFIDKIIPPETRAKMMNAFAKFTSEKPMLASFLMSQVALSGPALGLFVTMTISIALFAIIVALILAVLGSVIFILFWVGVALIFLLPTLFVTIGIATFLWLWGVGTYYILKYFNEKPIPGIHTSLKDGIVDNLGADNPITHQLSDLTGQKIEGGGEKEGEKQRKEIEDGQGKKKKKETSGDGDGKKEKSGANGHADPKKVTDAGKQAGGKAQEAAGGAKDKASGAAGTVTGVAGGAKGAVGA